MKFRFCLMSVIGCIALAALAETVPNPLPEWAFGGFVRPEGKNPVIKPNAQSVFLCPMQKKEMKWEESDTFNPAATVWDGKLCVLYRAEDNTYKGIGKRTSRIGFAATTDGVTFTREPAPVLYPDEDAQKENEWSGGCEDPRIARTEDGTYVMTYTSWNRKVARLCVATSKDLHHWRKHGPAFWDAENGRYRNLFCKSAVIVTEPSAKEPGAYTIAKINGRYLMYWGEAQINAATSDDLIHWNPVIKEDGSLLPLIRPRRGFFDSTLTEVGAAAIKTDKGILVFYNGKNGHGDNADRRFGEGAYCAGQVLFDLKDPYRAIGRLDVPFFRPMADFERKGQYAEGTVFIEGLAFYKGKWYLYYGCADSLVGVAVYDPNDTRRLGDPIPVR